MNVVPLDTFTDTNPTKLPDEVERLIKKNDRRYTKWFRTLFRLGWHYGYTECLMKEPAKLIVEPNLALLDTQDLDLVFTALMNWSKKKAKDPAILIQNLKTLGLVISRVEMPFESLGGD